VRRFAVFAALCACVAPGQDIPRDPKTLRFGPLRAAPLPAAADFTLPNGMRVLLIENHELPVVRGLALIRAGSVFDPAGEPGLAASTARAIRSGAEVDEALDDLAASIDSHAGEEHAEVSFAGPAESAAAALDIFRKIVTAPAFAQDRLDPAAEPPELVSRELGGLIYGRLPEKGKGNRITRDSVAGFHRRYYVPENVTLAIAGDLRSEEWKRKIADAFAGWERTGEPARFPDLRPSPAPGIFFAPDDTLPRAYFSIGQPGGLRNHPDHAALELAAAILGETDGARLPKRLQAAVSAAWEARSGYPGLFRISGSAAAGATSETIRAIQEEVSKLQAGGVTAGELEAARQRVLNNRAFQFDALREAALSAYYGYPRDFALQSSKALAAVTRPDIARVAKQYLRTEDWTIVIAGAPGAFGEPLASLGLPVHRASFSSQPAPPVAAEPKAASGLDLLRRVQEAVGGAGRLADVKDYFQTCEFKMSPGAGGMTAKQTNRWAAPSHYRQESEMAIGKIAAYSDGATGWLVTPQGKTGLPPALLKQIQADLFRSYFQFLVSDRIPGRTVTAPGRGVIEISDGQGNSARLSIDESTGLPLKQTYMQMQPSGPPSTVEEVYSAWMDVSGIKVPSRMTISQNGRRFADVTVTGQKINVGVSPEELSKWP
jgi:predicted Zn-dependent peptidase